MKKGKIDEEKKNREKDRERENYNVEQNNKKITNESLKKPKLDSAQSRRLQKKSIEKIEKENRFNNSFEKINSP